MITKWIPCCLALLLTTLSFASDDRDLDDEPAQAAHGALDPTLQELRKILDEHQAGKQTGHVNRTPAVLPEALTPERREIYSRMTIEEGDSETADLEKDPASEL